MARLPMFPLSSVLFPGAVLPLQVFEPRYVELVGDVEAADRRFGVVLIEKGHEVGGLDTRTNVGTVAQIVRRGSAEDGRILLTAIGRERIRVVEWRDDDPYPRADVVPYPEPDPGPDVLSTIEHVLKTRRRLLAFAIEMGATGQRLDLRLPEDPIEATWAMCEAAPVGPFDRHRLLEIETSAERLKALDEMLSTQLDDLQSYLRRG
jgi:Lon protease-like protein